MSMQITEAFVKQYGANVFHLAQQKGSRLRPYVRQESQKGKAEFFDAIGAVSAVKKQSRHSDTPQIDTPHSRRMVTLSDYEWADLVDNQDKIRTLIDPANQYVQAAAWAFGRSMDDEIISAALGTAYSGEEGTTAVSLLDAQKLVCFDGSATTGVNLNVGTLIKLKERFANNNVDPDAALYLAVQQSQISSLLGSTQVTSSDYNSVKALVEGKIDTFMGFKFIQIQRLPRLAANLTYTVTDGTSGAGTGTVTSTKSRSCFAWAEGGLLMSIGQDFVSRISERADKSYAMQPYASMSIGAVRMEEARFVNLICSE
jgi:Phage capsid protein